MRSPSSTRTIACLVGATAAGWVAWSGDEGLVPLAVVALILWRTARTRAEAFFVALLYYAGAAHGLANAAAFFFDPEGRAWEHGVAVVALAVALCALPWAVLWSPDLVRSPGLRLGRGLLLALALLVPPVGLVSFANPFVGGASAFPAIGPTALLAVVAFTFAPSGRRAAPAIALALVLSAGLSERASAATPATVPFVGLSTAIDSPRERSASNEYSQTASLLATVNVPDPVVLLLPETVGGTAGGLTTTLWSEGLASRTAPLLVGMLHDDPREQVRLSGMMVFDQDRAWFWPQRFPAPFGMWAPWRQADHVESRLMEPGAREFRGHRVGLLVCFEQFVSWPFFQTSLARADVILAPANLWFDETGRLGALRRVSLFAWGSMMGWHTIGAVNV